MKQRFTKKIQNWDNKTLLNAIETHFTYSPEIQSPHLDVLIESDPDSEEAEVASFTALFRELRRRLDDPNS